MSGLDTWHLAHEGGTDVLVVPKVVSGRVVAGDGPFHEVHYDHDSLVVRLPLATTTDIDAVLARRRSLVAELADLSVRDVSLYLNIVGNRWFEVLADFGARYGPVLQRVTGLPWRMLVRDYEALGVWLAHRVNTYDMLRAELGTETAMDEWHRVESVRQRAFPRGLVFHGLVGNIPLAALFSTVRGLVSRNQNVLKLPSRDPLSALMLACVVVESVPNHPLTEGISALYWPHGSPVANQLLPECDAACLWGSDDAIAGLREKLAPSAPTVVFGPRWSCSVVDIDQLSNEEVRVAARRLAGEVSFYDQEACLSVQRLLVVGDFARFRPPLLEALANAERDVPPVHNDVDVDAQVLLATTEAAARGWATTCGEAYRLVELPKIDVTVDHPLARTLYVHQLQTLDGVAKLAAPALQTIAVYPWALADRVAAIVGPYGGSRVVELGLSRHPRRGFIHDGQRPLQALVRYIGIEDDLVAGSKYSPPGSPSTDDWLFWHPEAGAAT